MDNFYKRTLQPDSDKSEYVKAIQFFDNEDDLSDIAVFVANHCDTDYAINHNDALDEPSLDIVMENAVKEVFEGDYIVYEPNSEGLSDSDKIQVYDKEEFESQFLLLG